MFNEIDPEQLRNLIRSSEQLGNSSNEVNIFARRKVALNTIVKHIESQSEINRGLVHAIIELERNFSLEQQATAKTLAGIEHKHSQEVRGLIKRIEMTSSALRAIKAELDVLRSQVNQEKYDRERLGIVLAQYLSTLSVEIGKLAAHSVEVNQGPKST